MPSMITSLFFSSLVNDAHSSSEFITLNDWMIAKNELEWI